MRPKILAIQFRKDIPLKEREQACTTREAGIYTDIDFLDALDTSIDFSIPEKILNNYSGVIFGGSGDLDFDGNRDQKDEVRLLSRQLLERLRPLFFHIFENDIPTLGICYGHQLIGAFAGAEVIYDEQQKKNCSHELKLLVDKNNHFIFSDLPESFFAHYGHKDVLNKIPEGAVLLMNGGDKCKVPALRYKENIFTTQFHPELNYEDMIKRIKSTPGYLPEGVMVDEVFKNDPDSNKILRNFSKFVALRTLNESDSIN